MIERRHPSQVPLHGPAGAAELGSDGLDGPPVDLELGRSNDPIRNRVLGSHQAKSTGDKIAVVRTEPAVPATTHVPLFGSQRERQAGKAGRATGAAGHDGLVWPALVGVEGIGVHAATCSPYRPTSVRSRRALVAPALPPVTVETARWASHVVRVAFPTIIGRG
jgi:hypothetical protein